jgi:hypothetical protein
MVSIPWGVEIKCSHDMLRRGDLPVIGGLERSLDNPFGVLIHGSGFAGEGSGVLKAGVMEQVDVLCGG